MSELTEAPKGGAMNAEEVIRSCFAVNDSYAEHVTFCALDALRAACGGGPVVILDDGTLATLTKAPNIRGLPAGFWDVVLVGE